MQTVVDPHAAISLLAFWREAGVDACYEEEPVDRTAPRAPVSARGALQPAALAPARPGEAEAGAAIAEARRLAAGAADLDALKAAIAGFQGCALARAGARQAVFARGAPHATVMIVGEAPGAEEDLQGLPLVGRAGKLLDRMLAAAGLTEDAFITNTVFWRPPGNGQPSPQDQAVCRPFLERAIALVRPQILLAVGGASAKFLLDREEGILTLRGRWTEWRSEDGTLSVPLLPTLHPAFLLRNPPAKKKAWADLLELTQRVDRLRNGALQVMS